MPRPRRSWGLGPLGVAEASYRSGGLSPAAWGCHDACRTRCGRSSSQSTVLNIATAAADRAGAPPSEGHVPVLEPLAVVVAMPAELGDATTHAVPLRVAACGKVRNPEGPNQALVQV